MSLDATPVSPEDVDAARRRPVSRVSISLPEDLLENLDGMVQARGFASRSHAVSTILHRSLVEHRHETGDHVMVGTITLFYDPFANGLQDRLAELKRRSLAEMISSLHVHLMQSHTLEVILVQGRARRLQEIADAMITERGVLSGRLELAAALIAETPPCATTGKTDA